MQSRARGRRRGLCRPLRNPYAHDEVPRIEANFKGDEIPVGCVCWRVNERTSLGRAAAVVLGDPRDPKCIARSLRCGYEDDHDVSPLDLPVLSKGQCAGQCNYAAGFGPPGPCHNSVHF